MSPTKSKVANFLGNLHQQLYYLKLLLALPEEQSVLLQEQVTIAVYIFTSISTSKMKPVEVSADVSVCSWFRVSLGMVILPLLSMWA